MKIVLASNHTRNSHLYPPALSLNPRTTWRMFLMFVSFYAWYALSHSRTFLPSIVYWTMAWYLANEYL